MLVSALVTMNGLSVTARQLHLIKCQLDDFYKSYDNGIVLLTVFLLIVTLLIVPVMLEFLCLLIR